MNLSMFFHEFLAVLVLCTHKDVLELCSRYFDVFLQVL